MSRWTLDALGWRPALEQERLQLRPAGLLIGRIAIEYGGLYRVIVPSQDARDRDHAPREINAALPGKWRHSAPLEIPAVGDWVALRVGADGRRAGLGDGADGRRPRVDSDDSFAIDHRFVRHTQFLRQAAGRRPVPQVVGANVDVVFVVVGLDNDFNPRRIERYLSAILDGGARPVIVLSKADLAPDPQQYYTALAAISTNIPIETVSVHRDEGLERLRAHLGAGQTGALTGSSGVGKSTIVNALVGTALQRTQDVRRHDSRGRHTTTHRELILLSPEQGLLVDTPGMRELQLWTPHEGVDRAFEDVHGWAIQCRFRDCGHRGEPGCEVEAAVQRGDLSSARRDSYLKLKDEDAAPDRRRVFPKAAPRVRGPRSASRPRRRR